MCSEIKKWRCPAACATEQYKYHKLEGWASEYPHSLQFYSKKRGAFRHRNIETTRHINKEACEQQGECLRVESPPVLSLEKFLHEGASGEGGRRPLQALHILLDRRLSGRTGEKAKGFRCQQQQKNKTGGNRSLSPRVNKFPGVSR